MRLVSALIAAGVTLSAAAPAVAAPPPVPVRTTPTTVAFYGFPSPTAPGAPLPDSSGLGHHLTVRSADGGAVKYFAKEPNQALLLPPRCTAGAAQCARVLLETPHRPELNPGTQRFRYGAKIIGTAGAVGSGSNVMQKGNNPGGGQYKLQIGARGKPNCVLTGQAASEIFLARSSVAVTDGAWHQIFCLRTSTTLDIYVDGVARGSVMVPATVNVANTMPLRLGARNLSDRTDRFGGGIDDVFVIIGG